jgi:voltage-gated potassium channel
MALLSLRPRVVDYLEITGQDQQELRLEEVVIEESSPLVGAAVGDVAAGATPLLLRRADGRTVPSPSAGERLEANDMLVLLGEPRTLRRAEGVR